MHVVLISFMAFADLQNIKRISTARVSLRKYFIPGCVGRGLDLDLRIRPAAPASGPKWVGPSWVHVGGPKLGPSGLAPLGLRSKNKVFKLSGR